jgi:hypothetical protein
MKYTFLIAPVATVGGWYVLKRMAHRGGAADAEVHMPLPGDSVVPDPIEQTTHGVTVEATPQEIWPWLAQMGYYRAGWYTDPSGWWDRWIDPFLFLLLSKKEKGEVKPRTEHSADHIIAEYQNLKVGEIIEDGPPGTAYFTITDLEPNHALVLHSTSHVRYIVPPALRNNPTVGIWCDFTWAFILNPLDAHRTRLLLRTRARYGPAWFRLLFTPVLYLFEWLMPPVMLGRIKARVEQVKARDGVLGKGEPTM